ncbi:thiamine-phosphate kinase [Halocatena salina]|uniref:Thiamine-monophosphate kinase n=1 Tax=Halocatena salina TaxID=2934340 RepID=A0A8U0A4M7_9EURY|nr:thiamine-phosphate kinase [Halocatena salina]UPM44155.1 thiamine-phosphate kinase [Halocatena salina]
MHERAALSLIDSWLPAAGDDGAVVDDLVISTDMLHESTDFPTGTTRYTAGWRSVGASLSDIAAMGVEATAAVAVYGSPSFEENALRDFIDGARAACDLCDAAYVGGDLDEHAEFTVATTAIGSGTSPVSRSGATPGETLCVTGTLGRSAAALELFEHDPESANSLFRFEPRVTTGQAIASHAGAMMDSSDGLARSLHQLADASGCGFDVDRDSLPIDERVYSTTTDASEAFEHAVHFGEDFELVFTTDDVGTVQTVASVPVTPIGTVTERGVTIDGEPLPDRGYSH